jgi:hypothetical protein
MSDKFITVDVVDATYVSEAESIALRVRYKDNVFITQMHKSMFISNGSPPTDGELVELSMSFKNKKINLLYVPEQM